MDNIHLSNDSIVLWSYGPLPSVANLAIPQDFWETWELRNIAYVPS